MGTRLENNKYKIICSLSKCQFMTKKLPPKFEISAAIFYRRRFIKIARTEITGVLLSPPQRCVIEEAGNLCQKSRPIVQNTGGGGVCEKFVNCYCYM